MIMEYQKVTISLPVYVNNLIKNKVPAGKRSKFIALAIEEKLIEQPYNQETLLKDISELREKAQPYKRNLSIKKAIDKGRT